LSKLVLYK